MNELIDFCLDTENPEKNYKLAQWYEKQNHTASAHVYYFRAAERTENKNFAYTSLLRSSICYKNQGKRDATEKLLIHAALSFLSEKPEAYYFLSLFYQRKEEWDQCYLYADFGLKCYENEVESIDLPEYQGKYALIYQKALASWWWGKGDESKKLFQLLKDEHWDVMNDEHRKICIDNLKKMNAYDETPFPLYNKKKHSKLKFKFNDSEKIEKNFSESYQDMFVLSMLNGKKSGTYLEIGAGNSFYGNNTALLEQQFNWTGVSLDIDEGFVNAHTQERKNPCLLKDATKINYEIFLSEMGFSNEIDYLQLDCDPPEVTYKILLTIPFETHKFAVITYEHDYYCDETKSFQEKSRKYLESYGYVRIVNNISPDGERSYEDWWVHPDLIDNTIINKMLNIDETIKKAEDYILYIDNRSPLKYSKETIKVNNLILEKYTIDDKNLDTIENEEQVLSNTTRKKIGFDVGACLGESIPKFEGFDEIYAFEPAPNIFNILAEKCKDDSRIKCFQIGISDENGLKSFNYHDHYGYSSFLEIDKEGEFAKKCQEFDPGFDNIVAIMDVQTKRLDTFMQENCIEHIDFLKIDTQGNDLNVIKSLGKMIDKVDTIELEVQIKPLYKNSSSKEKIVDFMQRNNFNLISEESNHPLLEDYEKRLIFKRRDNKFCFLNNSKSTSWIVDNFYDNPDEIRKFALEQEFGDESVITGFVGRRTFNQFLFPGLKEAFESVMGKKITKWEEHGMNGRFQICWSGERLVYHCDEQMWGGMIYLSPNAPYQCGTTLYADKKNRARTYYDPGWDEYWGNTPGDCHLDRTPFEPVDVLGNVYNRLVIFDASCIHSASEYFGTNKENARLWQMFFFDTEE